MTTPVKPWETNSLQNSTQLIRNGNIGPSMPQIAGRSAPVLPPRPSGSTVFPTNSYGSYNSYMPYSGYGTGYGGYGNYSSYGSYGMPYRNSLYNSYGSSYGGYNSYGMGYQNYDDTERRFIQYAEESSRNTFANVEGIVRAFNSLAMMLDNTFFAMTSSFRAVLSVAENFGRLRTMFGHIWYSINIFRMFTWLYRKLREMMGYKMPNSASSRAWKEAASGALPGQSPSGSNWPTLAFLGVIVSAPYIISKFLPKYEDKSDPANWKSPGIRAKAAFDFIASSSNELTVHTNDDITLAPSYIQEEMNLKNSGWAFAVLNGRSGVVPLNYLVINKSSRPSSRVHNNHSSDIIVPRSYNNSSSHHKTHTKRVSFGENQVFENVDLDDYILPSKNESMTNSLIKTSRESNDETKIEPVEVKVELPNKEENKNNGTENNKDGGLSIQ